MTLDPGLRALLVCPQCHGDLLDAPAAHEAQGAGLELQCPVCRLGYSVGGDGIPDMLVDDARPLDPALDGTD